MPEPTDDYQNLVNLLAVFSEATGQMATLEGSINAAYLDIVDDHKTEYAALQKTLTESEGALITLAKQHPEWFAEAKTIKTPFGEVHSQKTTTHTVSNETATIELIKHARDRAAQFGNDGKAETLKTILKVEESINLKRCAELTEKDLQGYGIDLQHLGISRTNEESITVKPAKVSLGQAVKASDKRKDKAEKAKAKEVTA